jgi:hypothetical protein
MAFFVKKLQANPDLLEVALDINRKIEQMYYWSKPVIS